MKAPYVYASALVPLLDRRPELDDMLMPRVREVLAESA